ncbi:hypothetical protein V6N13_048334 [Hibiscus sabdariffa]
MLCIKSSDCGCDERCFGNNGTLSIVGGLPLARPLFGLVKLLQNSLVEQELIELVNRVVGFYPCLAWPMFSFISSGPRVVEFVVNPSGFYQGQCPCLYLDFCML